MLIGSKLTQLHMKKGIKYFEKVAMELIEYSHNRICFITVKGNGQKEKNW
jgi:hypothetical protein